MTHGRRPSSAAGCPSGLGFLPCPEANGPAPRASSSAQPSVAGGLSPGQVGRVTAPSEAEETSAAYFAKTPSV